MSYIQIELPDSLPINIIAVVREVIDPLFEEFHFLLTVRRPDQGPKGSFQRMQAIVLVALADGAAQFFWPVPKLNQGDRFKAFLKQYYPWDADKPEGLTQDDAVNFLWNDVRCAMLHRYGVRHGADRLLKFGNMFGLSENEVEEVERAQERPHSEPFLQRNEERTVLWIENFYWGLRQAIQRVINEKPEYLIKIDQWIVDGKFDQKKKSNVIATNGR